MNKSSKHNQTPFDKIEMYVLGKMSASEKNAFEKQALEDPFLQDAIDGYISNPSAIQYFKQSKTRFKTSSQLKNYMLIFGVFGVLVLSVLLYRYNHQLKNNQVVTKNDLPELNHNKSPQKFEVLSQEIDTLTFINDSEQIKHTEISLMQNEREIFKQEHPQSNPDNQTIDLIDIQDEEEDEELLDLTVNEKIKVYPFVYFYELAVVDYTKYENRTQTIEKTTYELSGTEAMFENQDRKQTSELIEKKVEVPYMEYLDETMKYFSKGKYKYALKRFEVIKQQYHNDLNALFYGGLSNFNLGRFNKALDDFGIIVNLNDNPFYEDALWYRAKTYLKLGQNLNAINDLEILSLTSQYYQKQALTLIKQINHK